MPVGRTERTSEPGRGPGAARRQDGLANQSRNVPTGGRRRRRRLGRRRRSGRGTWRWPRRGFRVRRSGLAPACGTAPGSGVSRGSPGAVGIGTSLAPGDAGARCPVDGVASSVGKPLANPPPWLAPLDGDGDPPSIPAVSGKPLAHRQRQDRDDHDEERDAERGTQVPARRRCRTGRRGSGDGGRAARCGPGRAPRQISPRRPRRRPPVRRRTGRRSPGSPRPHRPSSGGRHIPGSTGNGTGRPGRRSCRHRPGGRTAGRWAAAVRRQEPRAGRSGPTLRAAASDPCWIRIG